MFDECVIRGRRFAPARFCAPLAGYTHSAFRRLLADFGGCGAVWTEMLAAPQVLRENFVSSPWLRRRPQEPFTVFQLMVRGGDPMEQILQRLGTYRVEAVDLNLACDALAIRVQEAGSALLEKPEILRTIVSEARRHWPGMLTAKIRLGSRRPGWEAVFVERLRLLEDCGVDAVTLHPRFFEDKFRGRARLDLIPWAASHTRLPLIANGDILRPEQVEELGEHLRPACAIMIGRMAIARPWLFASWECPVKIDFAGVWWKMFDYIMEDFTPAVAHRRIQMFTKYYSANFAFGHQFYVDMRNAPSLPEARRVAEEFFSRAPATVAQPLVAGL